MNALSLEGLNIRYGHTQVLHELSFAVETGEFFVIIGPNGSGKTTLLKAIAGLLTPDSGDIALMGRPLSDYSRKEGAQVVAYVPQQLPLDFPFTVAETVLMGRTPHLGLIGHEQKRDYEIAEQAMGFTDVLHLAGRRLQQLSGGELQRVIIARAICQQPRIILLDEPTASLDPAHQIRIMDLMEQLRIEQNITVIMVSHDLNLAALYGDRLLLIKDGAMVRAGSPKEVCSYEMLEQTYGCCMLVDESPVGKVPRIVPVPGKYIEQQKGAS